MRPGELADSTMLLSPPSPPPPPPSPPPRNPPPPPPHDEVSLATAVGATSYANLTAIFTPPQEPFSSLARLVSDLDKLWGGGEAAEEGGEEEGEEEVGSGG